MFNCAQYLRDEIAAVGACVRFSKMAKNGKNPPWPNTAFPHTSMRLLILRRLAVPLGLVFPQWVGQCPVCAMVVRLLARGC